VRFVDRLSGLFAVVAAWLFFATGLMLGWEVAARYVFNAPTIWAEELSRLCLVWGTFGGTAALVHRRAHIRITVITDALPQSARTALEALSLAVVAAFGIAVTIYGFDIAWDSWTRGRTAGTILDLPLSWSQFAVPAGAFLFALQAIIEAVRTLRDGAPPPEHAADGESGGLGGAGS
jgi:C4-dicarboxylate transporter DctQ subunit